jgi:hypothetical protein
MPPPSSAGTKIKLVASVQPRLISSSVPMLAVPGCAETASDPKADPVVSAENTTARVVADTSFGRSPARAFITK